MAASTQQYHRAQPLALRKRQVSRGAALRLTMVPYERCSWQRLNSCRRTKSREKLTASRRVFSVAGIAASRRVAGRALEVGPCAYGTTTMRGNAIRYNIGWPLGLRDDWRHVRPRHPATRWAPAPAGRVVAGWFRVHCWAMGPGTCATSARATRKAGGARPLGGRSKRPPCSRHPAVRSWDAVLRGWHDEQF